VDEPDELDAIGVEQALDPLPVDVGDDDLGHTVDCIMFTRDEVGFCSVCRRAIERIISLYTD